MNVVGISDRQTELLENKNRFPHFPFSPVRISSLSKRKTVMEKSPLKFVPVERVGEALQLAVEEQK